MATTAQFVAAPIIDIAQVTTANANRNGTGTTVLVCSGPTFQAGPGIGKRITRGVIEGITANSAGVVRFYLSKDNGSSKSLYTEKVVTATAFAPTSPGFRSDIPELIGLVLPGATGSELCQLYASTQTTDTFNIIIESGTL
jgi:hypothetical protein